MIRSFILGFLWSALTFGLFIACCLHFKMEYEAVKKFYPEMTFIDYVLIKDHLRITPDGK